MDRLFCDSLSRNVAFKCLMFMPENFNRIVFVNGKHPRSPQKQTELLPLFVESVEILLILAIDTKKLLYRSIVRPQLEYSCKIWSSYSSKDKLLLEDVQRRATEFISNYPRDMSYGDCLLKFSLLPLEYRR